MPLVFRTAKPNTARRYDNMYILIQYKYNMLRAVDCDNAQPQDCVGIINLALSTLQYPLPPNLPGV